MPSTPLLDTIPDDELLLRLAGLLRSSRRTEADLVAHIGEVDARRLYAREASPSMWAYCTERLHLSGAEAYLRIAAARASREHPVILEMLADGRLHLTAVALLAPYLTPENRDSLLARATHKSKREVEELLAQLQPRPDVPARIRKLPERRTPAGSASGLLAVPPSPPASAGAPLGGLFPVGAPSARPAVGTPVRTVCPAEALPPGNPALEVPSVALRPDEVLSSGLKGVTPIPGCVVEGVRRRPAVEGVRRLPAIEPLSPSRYKVQFTASGELREKLERLQALMRSSIPGSDLAAVIEVAVTEKLERLESRRFGRTKAPRKTLEGTDVSPRSRHVPAAVRRAVHERDEDRCRYVDEQGRRCTAQVVLELHHRHTFACGGDHSPGNVALLCRVHNRHVAEVDYGRAAMAKHCRGAVLTKAP